MAGHLLERGIAVRYTFGSICVDADTREISTPAGTRHLTRKAWSLLLLLIERRPDVVPKDEIFTRVWPDAFVSESSLQATIHEIRRAIDDPARHQSWIRTVHGVGYSFRGHTVAEGRREAPALEGRAAAWLIGDATRLALRHGENIVGRGSDDVIEIESPTISRHHARIVVGDSVTIEDLASKNGTWLDGQRVDGSRPLTDGASVRLGSVQLTFRLASLARPTESVAD
jgi:DNA-binding winged helix-turn-helix (wHTH) protein